MLKSNPQGVVLIGEAIGRWLDHESEALIKESSRELPHPFCLIKTQQEVCGLEKGPDLRLPASRTVRNKFVYKSITQTMVFVIAARNNWGVDQATHHRE